MNMIKIFNQNGGTNLEEPIPHNFETFLEFLKNQNSSYLSKIVYDDPAKEINLKPDEGNIVDIYNALIVFISNASIKIASNKIYNQNFNPVVDDLILEYLQYELVHKIQKVMVDSQYQNYAKLNASLLATSKEIHDVVDKLDRENFDLLKTLNSNNKGELEKEKKEAIDALKLIKDEILKISNKQLLNEQEKEKLEKNINESKKHINTIAKYLLGVFDDKYKKKYLKYKEKYIKLKQQLDGGTSVFNPEDKLREADLDKFLYDYDKDEKDRTKLLNIISNDENKKLNNISVDEADKNYQTKFITLFNAIENNELTKNLIDEFFHSTESYIYLKMKDINEHGINFSKEIEEAYNKLNEVRELYSKANEDLKISKSESSVLANELKKLNSEIKDLSQEKYSTDKDLKSKSSKLDESKDEKEKLEKKYSNILISLNKVAKSFLDISK